MMMARGACGINAADGRDAGRRRHVGPTHGREDAFYPASSAAGPEESARPE